MPSTNEKPGFAEYSLHLVGFPLQVLVLPPGKAQFADVCEPPTKTEPLKKQKQPATISSKVVFHFAHIMQQTK